MLTEAPAAPNVPIDYTALLCRRPGGEADAPAPPTRLAFLHRILEENQAQQDRRASEETNDAMASSSAALEEKKGDEDMIPPDNFAMVNSWLYRSSFPKKKHFPFLKTLGLRSVLYVVRLTQYPDSGRLSRAEYAFFGRKWDHLFPVRDPRQQGAVCAEYVHDLTQFPKRP